MFVVDLTFDCYQDTTLDNAEAAINRVVNALRFNGQIIGEEFPTVLKDGFFITRVMCPEEDSLHPLNHSPFVKHSIGLLQEAGLLAPKVKVIGQDIHSNGADMCHEPSCFILYTTYVHTCSPLYCGDDFQPVPLYKNPSYCKRGLQGSNQMARRLASMRSNPNKRRDALRISSTP